MTLQAALSLASRGFHVFPLLRNSKDTPLIKDFPNQATMDPAQIEAWFKGHKHNIGISTSRFGQDQALVVVDVDDKKGKHGSQTLLGIELDGYDLPLTLEHSTPSGGRHLLYVAGEACKQGTDVLGEGLDIRSRGGYVLAPGSTIEGQGYAQINGHRTLAPAPAWLVDRLGADRRDRTTARVPLAGVDPARAEERGRLWLTTSAPLSIEGQAGDQTAFKVAASLKDYGCTEDQTFWLMWEDWNDRCAPPWSADDLEAKVKHAFKYGSEAPGSAAPEAIFPAVQPEPEEEEPSSENGNFTKLNDKYAFIKQGAYILYETTDVDGRYTTQHMDLGSFHAWHANHPFSKGSEKPRPISMHWMEWHCRRQYEGVVFLPEKDAGSRWYNLWRGFSTKPAPLANHPSLSLFLEHALENVCGGDAKLFTWLMGYFAHMIQRPWEKPLVALVMKGRKGTGKNALLERVGNLLGDHFLVADDERYLLSNFNAHLESNLFFVLDEAAWAGDKKSEGRLKGLITGQNHNIERKGMEHYKSKNLTRVAIIGNEDWLVPATQDERRFAVFNVGEGRLQDRKFFIDMREGMEQGGYAHLLRYLLDFDLSQVDVNDAPNTVALVEQKIASLEPLPQWWYDCLTSGQIAGGDWAGEWPEEIPTSRLREAYSRWSKGRNIRSRLESETVFGRTLKKLAPRIKKTRHDNQNCYHTPSIEVLREDWEKYLGGRLAWFD